MIEASQTEKTEGKAKETAQEDLKKNLGKEATKNQDALVRKLPKEPMGLGQKDPKN